jgi:hypothetical protein
VVGIVAEEPYGGGRRTAMVLGGPIAVMEVVCHHRDLEYAFVNSSALESSARKQGIEPLNVRQGLQEARHRAAADALATPTSAPTRPTPGGCSAGTRRPMLPES